MLADLTKDLSSFPALHSRWLTKTCREGLERVAVIPGLVFLVSTPNEKADGKSD